MENSYAKNLKLSEKGVWVSIIAYTVLSVGQIAVANIFHSSSLQANGFNNLTDILGNIAILIGLRIARIPADNNHVYGHWKIESIASLVSSFIMFYVGFEVLRDTVVGILSNEHEKVEPIGAIVAFVSAVVMICVYLYARNLAKKTKSQALVASSKDNLSDAVTSIGTTIAIIAGALGWVWLDKLMAIIICGFILKTAYDIFHDSVFTLSDGFDEELVEEYKLAIEIIPKVKNVKMVRGRSYGSNIFLDVVVEMSPDLSVYESHEATEAIEKLLIEKFEVYDVDVHVEPAQLLDEERYANRSLELLPKEEALLNLENLETLTSKDFKEILPNGEIIDAEAKLLEKSEIKNLAIKDYKTQQVSKKTFILTYEYWKNDENFVVTSIWRRNDSWYCIYRQSTKKSD